MKNRTFKTMITTTFLVVSSIVIFSCSEIEYGTNDIDSWPGSAIYELQHPCMLHTDADFEFIKERYAAGEEPWKTAYDNLIKDKYTNPATRKAQPVEEVTRDNYHNTLGIDALMAYQQALAWKLTDEDKYAEGTVEILNQWAQVCKKWISRDSNGKENNGTVLLGYQAYAIANAAELVRDYPGWQPEDFKAFQNWMKDLVYPFCYKWLTEHFGDSPAMTWCSWDTPAILSMMSVGILCDDSDMIDYAINYFKNGAGPGSIKYAVVDMHEDPAGKVQGRNLEQGQEVGRDQGHATINVPMYGAIAQTAYNIGVDLFAYDNNKILAICEYTAKFNIDPSDVDIDMPFTPIMTRDGLHSNVAPDGRGQMRPGWEIIYNHYAVKKGLNAPYSLKCAEKIRPENTLEEMEKGKVNGYKDQVGCGTLMFYRGAAIAIPDN